MSKTTSKSTKSKTPDRTTKGEKILKLLQHNAGATIAEMAKAVGWQTHSVRGFLSGAIKRKRRIRIKSSKKGDKPRRYVIEGTAK